MSSPWDTNVAYEKGVRDAIAVIEEEADTAESAESLLDAIMERLCELIDEDRELFEKFETGKVEEEDDESE